MLTRIIIILLSASIVSACATYNSVPRNDGKRPYTVSAGDNVRVYTNDNQRQEFKVTEVTDSAIRGEQVEVLYEEIDRISVEEVDAVPVAIGAGVAIWVLVIGLFLAALGA